MATSADTSGYRAPIWFGLAIALIPGVLGSGWAFRTSNPGVASDGHAWVGQEEDRQRGDGDELEDPLTRAKATTEEQREADHRNNEPRANQQ